MKRGILLVSVLLLVAACGSSQTTTSGGTHGTAATPTPTPSTDTLKVVMAGAGNMYGAGATITNESKSLAATNVTLQATVKDTGGAVIGTDTQDVSIIHPGERLPVAINVETTGLAGSAEVVADVGRWTSQDEDPHGRIAGSNISIAPPDDGSWTDGYTVTAQVSSTYSRTFSPANVAVVCFDSSGNIVGADLGSVDTLPANGSASASWNVFGPMPTMCEVGGWP